MTNVNREYYLKNREQLLIQRKKHYLDNREETILKQKEYNLKNRTKISKRQRIYAVGYREDNKEIILIKTKYILQYRKRFYDEVMEFYKEHHQENIIELMNLKILMNFIITG
jgi:hypothetical protein